MNTTTNYNLPQWEDTDVVTRESVNGAMAAVDAALAGKAHIEALNYVGTGTYGLSNRTTYTFTGKPVAIFVFSTKSFHISDGFWFYSLTRNDDQIAIMRRTTVAWGGNTASIYSPSDPAIQANEAGVSYDVMALYL